jgi:hypothetical protein
VTDQPSVAAATSALGLAWCRDRSQPAIEPSCGNTRLVPFIAEYEDGSEGHFDIDLATLRSGDHIAPMVASEKQRDGHLPPGKIVRVRRDWETYYRQ